MRELNKGDRFGRMTVLYETDTPAHIKIGKYPNRYFYCKCDCGNKRIVRLAKLHSESCGCLRNEIVSAVNSGNSYTVTHGMTRGTARGCKPHPLYTVYSGMKQRCYDKNYHRYADWGGRGITICPEWLADKTRFFHWAVHESAPPWKIGLQIERIDNDKNYSPDNCCFTTPVEESNNRRNNHRPPEGKGLTLAQLSVKTGIGQGTLRWRAVNGKPLFAPVRQYKRIKNRQW